MARDELFAKSGDFLLKGTLTIYWEVSKFLQFYVFFKLIILKTDSAPLGRQRFL